MSEAIIEIRKFIRRNIKDGILDRPHKVKNELQKFVQRLYEYHKILEEEKDKSKNNQNLIKIIEEIEFKNKYLERNFQHLIDILGKIEKKSNKTFLKKNSLEVIEENKQLTKEILRFIQKIDKPCIHIERDIDVLDFEELMRTGAEKIPLDIYLFLTRVKPSQVTRKIKLSSGRRVFHTHSFYRREYRLRVPLEELQNIEEGTYEISIDMPYLISINVKESKEWLTAYKIRLFYEPAPIPTKLRAERLSREELDFQPDLVGVAGKISSIPSRAHTTELLGIKGTGKTFGILKAFREFLKNSNYIPLMYEFYGRKAYTLHDPLSYGNEEEWGDRLKIIQPLIKLRGLDATTFSMIENVLQSNNYYNIIMAVDDIHYVFENAEKNPFQISSIKQILKNIINLSHYPNFYSLLVTEEPLSFYAEKFKDDELKEMLKEFGEFRPHDLKDIDIRILNRVEVPLLNRSDIEKLIKIYLSDKETFKCLSQTGILRTGELLPFLETITSNNMRKIIYLFQKMVKYIKERNIKGHYFIEDILPISDELRIKIADLRENITTPTKPPRLWELGKDYFPEKIDVYDRLRKELGLNKI